MNIQSLMIPLPPPDFRIVYTSPRENDNGSTLKFLVNDDAWVRD